MRLANPHTQYCGQTHTPTPARPPPLSNATIIRCPLPQAIFPSAAHVYERTTIAACLLHPNGSKWPHKMVVGQTGKSKRPKADYNLGPTPCAQPASNQHLSWSINNTSQSDIHRPNSKCCKEPSYYFFRIPKRNKSYLAT